MKKHYPTRCLLCLLVTTSLLTTTWAIDDEEIESSSLSATIPLSIQFANALLIAGICTENMEYINGALRHGAKVDAQDANGDTSLHYAVTLNKIKVAKHLLKRGATIDIRNRYNETPLHQAVHQGNLEMVRILLRYDANPLATDEEALTPIHLAVLGGNTLILRELLTHLHGEQQRSLWTGERTPFYTAVINNQVMALRVLLALKGAEITEEQLNTLLLLAAKHDQGAIVGVLLSQGHADPNIAGLRTRNTPLYNAAINGNENMVLSLLTHGANPDTQVRYDYTPLHAAAHAGFSRIVFLLLWNRGDPNALSLQGSTPLHHAAQSGSLQTVRLLLLFGANPRIISPSAGTALHIAVNEGLIGTIQMLLDAEPSLINVRDSLGRTPLHIAAHYGVEALIQNLLDRGANRRIRTTSGQTAADIATENGHEAATRLLSGIPPQITVEEGIRTEEDSDHEDYLSESDSDYETDSTDIESDDDDPEDFWHTPIAHLTWVASAA